MLRQLLCATLLASGLAARAFSQSSTTIVIVVRHAEKATAPASDPPLTDAGVARAKALASALLDANVQAVISTALVRTRETARPTAESRGLTIETVPLAPIADHAKAVADAVRKHMGQTVLVVGHSNTVGAIIAALGGPRTPNLCESQYSNLYTLVLDRGATTLIRGSYGAPSPDPPTGCPSEVK